MPVENYIIERIEYFCAKKKLSRYRLAQRAGIAQSSLSTLLNRKSIPSIQTLERICDGLDITLAQFFAGDSDIPDLTDEQKELLTTWSALDDNQRALVQAYMQGLSQK
ncbi:MAG: helix-turn-helix domain-containing protein [Clostridia bacterium]|nr:helix-turn-helix domain-containing protein [Clostridia bacterium]